MFSPRRVYTLQGGWTDLELLMGRAFLIVELMIRLVLEDRLRGNGIAFAQRRRGVRDPSRDVRDDVWLAVLVDTISIPSSNIDTSFMYLHSCLAQDLILFEHRLDVFFRYLEQSRPLYVVIRHG